MTSHSDVEPVIRTIATARHVNVNDQVFGGWLVSQLDHAGGLVGERLSKGPVTTAAIKEVRFIQPVLLGETVSVYLREVEPGTTSIRLSFDIIAEKLSLGNKKLAVTGTLVVVAIDDQGVPRAFEQG